MGLRPSPRIPRDRHDSPALRPLYRREGARPLRRRGHHHLQPGHRGTTRRDREGDPRRRRPRHRGRRSCLSQGLVQAAPTRARQVPLPHQPHLAGAQPRVCRHRNHGLREADPRVTRCGCASRRGALLVLRRLGRQASIRRSRSPTRGARRRRAGDPMELPAPHVGVEDCPSPCRRQHRGSEARLHDAAHRASLRRCLPPGRTPRRRRQHRHRPGQYWHVNRHRPARREGRLHRQHLRRRHDRQGDRRTGEGPHAGARWQGGQHRL